MERVENMEKDLVELQSMTEDLFKEVLSTDKVQFQKLKLIQAKDDGEAYSAGDVKKYLQERNPKEYHRQLKKYMDRMVEVYKKQLSQRVNTERRQIQSRMLEESRKQIEQSRKQMEQSRKHEQESRKQAFFQKVDDFRRLIDSVQKAMMKKQEIEKVSQVLQRSRRRSEWELVDNLFELLDQDKKKWLSQVKLQHSQWKAQNEAIKQLKPQDTNTYINQLMKLNQIDKETIDTVNASLTSQTDRITQLQQNIKKLTKNLQQKQLQIVQQKQMHQERRQNLNKREQLVEKQQKAIEQQKIKFQQQQQQIRDIEKQLTDTKQLMEKYKINHDIYTQLNEAVSNQENIMEQTKIIHKHFKKFNDKELQKLAEMWSNSGNTMEYAIRMQSLIALRQQQNRKKMLQQGGFQTKLQQFMKKTTNTIEGVITKAIDAFNKIQEIVLDKFYSVRLEPINDKINYDLDSVVDELAKEFHFRIDRIAKRLDKIRIANHRKAVEYVMRAPQKQQV